MEKRELLDLSFAYAVGSVEVDGKYYGLVASEERGGKAYLLDLEKGDSWLLWDGPGGTMATLGVGNREFLTIDGFYPVFDSRTASVSCVKVLGDAPSFTFRKTKLFDLPWCHRISFAKEEDGTYIVAGTLCREKAFVEDWSTKGSVYAIKYDGESVGEMENIFPEKILAHHAMWVERNEKGFDDIYTGGMEGIFRFRREERDWRVEKVLSEPTGDLALADLDGDGEKELAIIEGFHGTRLTLYKKKEGGFQKVTSYGEFPFGHVLWCGELEGKPRLLLGTRSGERFLKVFSLEGERLKEEKSFPGVSPAQVEVIRSEGKDMILVAAHGINKVVCIQ